LAREPSARFSVVGRSSGGASARDVSRSLSLRRLVVLVEWSDADAAGAGRARLDARWRSRGARVWSASLAPFRSHGTWRGEAAFACDPVEPGPEPTGVLASLTYAQIRPSKLGHFYVRGFPRTARSITGDGSGMLAGVGFGDVPIRHACTFSLWPTASALTAAVYGNAGPHGDVARRSTEEGWLSESLFARFRVVDHAGHWPTTDPLA
jgi:hypothetical protein